MQLNALEVLEGLKVVLQQLVNDFPESLALVTVFFAICTKKQRLLRGGK